MRNVSSKIAIKARSGIILPDHLRIKFHEQSAAVVAYTGKLNGVDFDGSLTFNAAPTWTRGGALAPASNTTVHALATAAAHPELFSTLTPPNGGGLIFLWSYYMTAYTNNSSASSILLCWGRLGAGGDGYSIGTTQGANHNIVTQFRGSGGGSIASAGFALNTLSTQITVQQYIHSDSGTLTGYTATNGNWSAATTATRAGAFGAGGIAAASFFSNVSTVSAVGTEYMNRGATDDKIISDLWVIRDTDGSLLAQMATIAKEHAKYRQELLVSLDKR